MSYYLAMHEAPCVGVAPVTFEAENDQDAENIAWIDSCNCPDLVVGGYDLYRITYNHMTHKHELTPVVPEYAFDDVAPCDEILPCDLDPFGECPKPEYARDCAKCRGWTQAEAEANATES